jgi:putative transposase
MNSHTGSPGVREGQRGARHFKKGSSVLCQRARVKYGFIRAHQDEFSVSRMCVVLKVSRNGYYGWRDRPESKRSVENRAVLSHIRAVHTRSRQAYGALKTWRELKAEGFQWGRHRIARLRREAGIEDQRKRRFRITTQSRAGVVAAKNRLKQCFKAKAANRVWVGDITFVPTTEGWLYLAVLIDMYSRRVVGWAMSERIDQQLALDALNMALLQRRVKPGLIHHTDQGRQYSSGAYQAVLEHHAIRASMSRRGNCYDNAVAESFFSSLKNELIHHRSFRSRNDARAAIFEYIEVFYNRQRRHQSLDFMSPVDYESEAGVY